MPQNPGRDPPPVSAGRTAWYSAASVTEHGSTFWLTPDGREVEVTSVGEDPYGWDDKVSVGPVVKFSRRGIIGRIERERPARERWR